MEMFTEPANFISSDTLVGKSVEPALMDEGLLSITLYIHTHTQHKLQYGTTLLVII